MAPALSFPDPPLADGVVALRAWRDEDVPTKVAWGRDAETLRWAGVPRGFTAEVALAAAAEVEKRRRAGVQLALAIVEVASGAVVGACEVRDDCDGWMRRSRQLGKRGVEIGAVA